MTKAAATLSLLSVLTSQPSERPGGKPSNQTPPEGKPASSINSSAEVFQYQAEWRLVHAGNVVLSRSRNPGGRGWQVDLRIQSVGLVSRLYKIDNRYASQSNPSNCATGSVLTALEGSRQREIKVTYDAERRKASSLERDLKKNTIIGTREIDIPSCVHDVIGALFQLRKLKVESGGSVQIPVSDGRKSVLARVEAQEQATIRTPAGSFQTTRYEAFLMNDVLYRRKGRLFVWLSNDERRLPVQVQVRLPFYVGTVTLQLEKVET